jgi:methylglutaconyl-CoA hydratase
MDQSKLQTIRLEPDGAVARVTLNRPDVHNAFNLTMVEELIAAFRALAREPDIRVIVLTGEGTSFCAGADLNWMREIISYSFEENVKESNRISDLMEAINFCPKATIARVQGATLGGGTGLAATCDLVIAADVAFFSLSEVRIGLVPACISPYIIARVGPTKARECFITGERIPAQRAAEMGLATECIPLEQLDGRVDERVSQILRNGPTAITRAKELVARVPTMPISVAKRYTAEVIAAQRIDAEGQEGMDAFLNRRKPNWVVS